MLRFPAVTGRLAPYRFYLEPKVGGIGRQVVNNGCRNSAGAVVSALLVKVNLQPYRNERLDAKHLKLESDAVMLRAWVHGGGRQNGRLLPRPCVPPQSMLITLVIS